ncbi:MAG: carbohydrate ABC transporter substrate-binding protein, partial [Glutamicibacter arilaitensis]
AKVQEYLASADWANSRVKLGGVISANSGLDPENASSDLLRSAVELLQDPSTTFRFDGSDLMPKSVGADSFWKGIVDWIDGKPTKEVLENIQAGYDS